MTPQSRSVTVGDVPKRNGADVRVTELIARRDGRDQINAAKLPKPLWNHDIYDANGEWLARPDAIWPDRGVVLEIDSLEWHLSPGSYRRTQARQRRLARIGLIVLPVTPAAVREDPRGFIAELKIALAEGRRGPQPAITVRNPVNTDAAGNGV